MTKVRALLGLLAVLMSLAFVAGCGFVSDRIQAIKPGNEEQNQREHDPQEQQARQEEFAEFVFYASG
jgi:hypothetical protein